MCGCWNGLLFLATVGVVKFVAYMLRVEYCDTFMIFSMEDPSVSGMTYALSEFLEKQEVLRLMHIRDLLKNAMTIEKFDIMFEALFDGYTRKQAMDLYAQTLNSGGNVYQGKKLCLNFKELEYVWKLKGGTRTGIAISDLRAIVSEAHNNLMEQYEEHGRSLYNQGYRITRTNKGTFSIDTKIKIINDVVKYYWTNRGSSGKAFK